MDDKPPSRPRRPSRVTLVTQTTFLPVSVFLLTTNLLSLAAAQAEAGAVASLPVELGVGRLLLGLALLLLSAFVSASDAALSSLGEWRLRQLWEGNQEPNGALALFERNPQRFTATLLIGRTALYTTLATLATVTALQLAAPSNIGPWTAAVYGALVTGLLILVFCELIPRSVAVPHALQVARVVIRPVYLLSIVVYPIGFAFTWLTRQVLRVFKIEPSLGNQMSESELKQMLRSAEESGVIEAQERQMIRGVIDLEETVVREVMTPRVDVVAIASDAGLLDLLKVVREHGYSRLPVYAESIDNVIGMVYARDLLAFLERVDGLAATRVADVLTSVQYVPETLSVLNLLRDMRIRKSHFAIVVDEFGGTSGVITLEDIIEEITGEIYDETDVDEEADIVELGDGNYRLLGSAHLESIGTALDLSFDEDGDYDTLAGFMIDEFGHIPEVGESMVWGTMRL
ncbi:MAG TPA: hemolysin family protein, partial [Trueperaceae bacterium]|nr:hemolysin family protein [Trueperaceae bacterium]